MLFWFPTSFVKHYRGVVVAVRIEMRQSHKIKIEEDYKIITKHKMYVVRRWGREREKQQQKMWCGNILFLGWVEGAA